ncbi:MAG: histidinol dehydrogenase [Planctomycetota bacterium]
MTDALLRRVNPSEITSVVKPPVDAETLDAARTIVDDVRDRGLDALRDHAERFGERTRDQPILLDTSAMSCAFESLDERDRAVLVRTAERIERFARAQRACITDLDTDVPGGRAGHTVVPVTNAGCYAPGGRYPLPSSALMTAVTARVTGCQRVVVASPGAHRVTLAAAHVAGADEFLAVGGAHAVAALAFGCEGFERVDVIAGPGNAYVTAAKQLVSGVVGIDMLAGPSELLVLADDSADPAVIAADLLAQAEHDTRAVPILVTTCDALPDLVEAQLRAQLDALRTRDVAAQALANGYACVAPNLDDAIRVCDTVAPEHLEVMTRDAEGVGQRLRNAGALFLGATSAEVFGDYGAGPNHTLPTGGTARFQSGLSITHFLRLRTWLSIEDPAGSGLIDDVRRLAELEGLAGHEASAAKRADSGSDPGI